MSPCNFLTALYVVSPEHGSKQATSIGNEFGTFTAFFSSLMRTYEEYLYQNTTINKQFHQYKVALNTVL